MVMYKYGYARVEAVNASYMTWEWVQSVDGVVYDRVSISQDGEQWVLPTSTSSSADVDIPTYGIALISGGALLIIALSLAMYCGYFSVPCIQSSSDDSLLKDTKFVS